MEMVGGCCVCLDERGWNENPLVYCDGHGCNVAVHQACYGIVKVPKGPWFCCKCQSTERVARVKCELCPFKEGALKRTDTGGWAHVVCALYIPEVRFGDVTTMEPILISSVPHERFLKMCYICEEQGRESKTSNGACMTCNKAGCKLNFHVTCAQSKRMLCEEAGHYGNVQYVGYCSQHWTKKFGNKGQHSASNSDVKKPTKDKEKQQRSRHDSVSSSDGSSNKYKYKKQSSSKSSTTVDNSVDVMAQAHALLNKNDCNGVKQEPQKSTSSSNKAKNPEQSAAESLNLLQQMPNMIDYFPPDTRPDTRPKTPLNTIIPPMTSPNQANTAKVSNKIEKTNSSVDTTEDLIDVESSSKTPPLRLDVPAQHDSTENGKEVKFPAPLQKSTPVPKKSTFSHSKSSNLKTPTHETKKRKTPDHEKVKKKQKIEDKKKGHIKRKEKRKDFSIPRPSKIKIYDDERMPLILSPNKREPSAESFKDLLESQWDQGAHLLMQKATNFNVGSLLSCLHQLRAENDDLESRLSQLSARRDRLIATTSRLSTPFDAHAELNRKLPLSSMLSKLNSEPIEKLSNSKEKKEVKSKLKRKESGDSDKPTHTKKVKSIIEKSRESQDEPAGYSDSSLDGLGCREVLSEDNSLNSSPKDIRTTKPTKKEARQKDASFHHDETRNSNNQNSTSNIQSLVQPAISLPSDPTRLIGDTRYMQNSPELLQQMMRSQQINTSRSNAPNYQAPPTMLEFLSAQLTNANNCKDKKNNGYTRRSPDAHMTGSYRPVLSSASNTKSPQEPSK